MIWMLLFMNLWAQDVLVQAPGTADVFFEKSRMKRPKAISFVEHQLKDSEGFDKEIIAELKKAQFQFLQGSLDKAKEHYHNIQDRQHEQPWTQKAQQIIHYSLLRLAQLETNEKKKHYWLEKAWLFSYEMPIDSKLFPPPLVQKYRELAKSNPPQVWALPKNGAEYDRILINGAEQKAGSDFIRYPRGKVQISFLSNKFHPVHLLSSTEDLQTQSLPINLLVQGNCDDFKMATSETTGVYYSIVVEYCDGSVVASQNQLKRPIAMPIDRPKSSKTNSVFQSKWFWIGAGIVATGLAWQAIENSNRSGGTSSVNPQTSSEPVTLSNR